MNAIVAPTAPLLSPGVTCWRKVVATRLALIQDAAATFAAIASAIEGARRSVFIIGWDIDSRTVLRPDDDQPTARLLPLLLHCLDRRPELEIFVLLWDYSIIYAWEREPQPTSQFGDAHPRLHFALDGSHASGASHHQKIVVVDDCVAFLGGVDLTTHRWDTPAHAPVDQRRRLLDGQLYEPFHDVHVGLAGPAAGAMGELARARWTADARQPRPAPTAACDEPGERWPASLQVDATFVEVGLARTLVLHDDPAPVKEIAALTVAAIAAAQRFIYAENQYLTSEVVARALALRLREEHGPEIVIVLPKAESGWKEQGSMGILRAQMAEDLVRQDRHRRLRLLTPLVSDGTLSRCVAVHSKVLVIDDRLAKIGSANFTSRSLGLDSECDLAIEAYDGRSRAFVASVRNRLLGEHLGRGEAEVAADLAGRASLLRLVDSQATSAPRRLVPAPMTNDALFDFAVLEGAMVDPAEPWSTQALLERAVPVSLRRRLARRWLRPVLLIALGLAVWAALRTWHPLTQAVHTAVDGTISFFAGQPAGPLLAALFVLVASAVFVPITLLATATLAVFGLWPGVLVAWVGAVLSASLSHRLGGRIGPRVLRWLPDRVERSLRHYLQRRGFWAVILMRLLPLGNFAVLNLAAGALGVHWRSFVLGNMVGLLPGMLGLGIVVDRVRATIGRPTPANIAVSLGVLAVLVAVTVVLKRRYRPHVAGGGEPVRQSGQGRLDHRPVAPPAEHAAGHR